LVIYQPPTFVGYDQPVRPEGEVRAGPELDPEFFAELAAAVSASAPRLTRLAIVSATPMDGQIGRYDCSEGPDAISLGSQPTGSLVGVQKSDSSTNTLTVTAGALTQALHLPGETAFFVSVGSDAWQQAGSWLSVDALKTYFDTLYNFYTPPTIGAVRLARATADTSVTSSTALIDATGMTLTNVVPGTYAIEMWLDYLASATNDLKIGLSVPAGSTNRVAVMGPTSGEVPVTGFPRFNYTDFGVVDPAQFSPTVQGDNTVAGVTVSAAPRGSLVVTQQGTVKLQVAQAVSGATATVLKANSWFKLTRMA